MAQEVIVYRSQYEKEMAEASYEMFSDFGAWLWIWVPIILKWYLLIALLVMVVYEVVTTVKARRFNGIKDGIMTGLMWPFMIWWAIKPFFGAIFSGKKLEWEKW